MTRSSKLTIVMSMAIITDVIKFQAHLRFLKEERAAENESQYLSLKDGS